MTTIQESGERPGTSGPRVIKVRGSLIAAAQMRMATEKRLGIPTPAVVKKIAEAK